MVAIAGVDYEAKLEAAREIAAHAAERRRHYDDDAAFPEENFREIIDAGLHTMSIPIEYGGLGLWQGTSYLPYYQILETLAAADSSTAQLVQIQTHASGIIAGLASESQKQYFLPKVVNEGALVASIGSEASLADKGPSGFSGELKRGPDGQWHLSCRKSFASLAPAAQFWLLYVAMEGEGDYAERLVLPVLPNPTPGATLVDDWDTMGMRSTVSWSLELKDVVVPDEWLIGEPGDWVAKDPRTFTLAYVANHLGTAQGVFDFVLDYIKERPHLAKDPVTLVAVGDLSSELEITREGLYAAARLWERGDDPDRAELQGMRILHIAKRTALKVSNAAFDILGARVGYRVFPLEQALRDIRMFTLHFRDNLYMQTVGGAVLGTPFSAKGARSGSSPGRGLPRHEHVGNLDAIG